MTKPKFSIEHLVSAAGATAGSLAAIGLLLFWFGNTTFATNTEMDSLKANTDTLEKVFNKEVSEIKKDIAVLRAESRATNDKLEDMKENDKKQEKLLWEILKEVRK